MSGRASEYLLLSRHVEYDTLEHRHTDRCVLRAASEHRRIKVLLAAHKFTVYYRESIEQYLLLTPFTISKNSPNENWIRILLVKLLAYSKTRSREYSLLDHRTEKHALPFSQTHCSLAALKTH